jgi:opacity protein-like surface antigen
MTFLVFFSIFFYSTLLFADNKKFYIGGGSSYAIENFDTDSDFDNTWGINAKVGYRAHEILMIEFNFDYLNNFESDDRFTFLGEKVDSEIEVTVYTFMLALKGYAPVYSDKVMFFVVVGGGVMYADVDTKVRGSKLGWDLISFQSKTFQLVLRETTLWGLVMLMTSDISTSP